MVEDHIVFACLSNKVTRSSKVTMSNIVGGSSRLYSTRPSAAAASGSLTASPSRVIRPNVHGFLDDTFIKQGYRYNAAKSPKRQTA